MPNNLFASDLDNTLLFSYKYAQEMDLCVEELHGKKQGYMTAATAERLKHIDETMLFVPVTSRSVEQYQRIHFPTGWSPRYALTTNGAILLVDGKVDDAWHQRHLKQVEPWREELLQIYESLKQFDFLTSFRVVDDMYLFAACSCAEEAMQLQNRYGNQTDLQVAASGRKVYFFPPPINKGSAVKELQTILHPAAAICAGDSTIDVPMLEMADAAIAPASLEVHAKHLFSCPEGQHFPNFVTETVLKFAAMEQQQ